MMDTKGCLTQQQIENLFPEFKEKLKLYANCCDQTGQIVKNKDYFKEYQSNPHNSSHRGGKKVS